MATQAQPPQTSRFTPMRFTNPGAYGWIGNAWANPRAPYTAADVPSSMRTDPSNTAYEWFRYSEKRTGGGFTQSNPPFSSDAAGRLIPALQNVNGAQARILRGFIRRAEYDTTDPLSTSRLYFMYNPPQIARDYVSYLDQGALDPFNTVFQSGNLVAPPSMMNFTFELFFDRQDEARDPNNPGVLVDMEYFDMVVRNVIPDPALQSMPDNGVMMVNPRDIVVVFSPEITVQGRPLNASLVYEKFTHRMIPTRMRIQLTMRVVYWGPLRDMTTYTSTAAETTATDTVNWTSTTTATTTITYGDLVGLGTGESVQAIIDTQLGLANVASTTSNSSALAFAVTQVQNNNTQYNADKRNQLWKFADCSSLVWGGFAGVGQSQALGWAAYPANGVDFGNIDIPSTATMYSGFKTSTAVEKVWGFDGALDTAGKTAGCKKMKVGDLLLRIKGTHQGDNHVAFVSAVSDTSIQTFAAKAPGKGCGYTTHNLPVNSDFTYTHGVHPLTLGGQSAATQNNDRTRL